MFITDINLSNSYAGCIRDAEESTAATRKKG